MFLEATFKSYTFALKIQEKKEKNSSVERYSYRPLCSWMCNEVNGSTLIR